MRYQMFRLCARLRRRLFAKCMRPRSSVCQLDDPIQMSCVLIISPNFGNHEVLIENYIIGVLCDLCVVGSSENYPSETSFADNKTRTRWTRIGPGTRLSVRINDDTNGGATEFPEVGVHLLIRRTVRICLPDRRPAAAASNYLYFDDE